MKFSELQRLQRREGITVLSADERIEQLEARLRTITKERDALRAKVAEMEKQEPFDADSDVFRGAFEAALKAGNWPATRQGDGYRSPSTQIAWRIAFSTVNRLKLYLAPGAQPAPSIKDAIIDDLQSQFDSEGITEHDSGDALIRLSDAIAAVEDNFAQPAPSVPDGFSREDLEAVADGLDGYEKTVNVGNVTGGGDDHLESTTAYAARFIRAMLAAAPEAKP